MTVFRGMRRAASVLLLPVLAACQTPDSRLYTLSVLPPATAAPAGAARTLALGALDLPPLVDRPQIVRRLDANRVEALEFDRWAEPLADGLRAALAGDLGVRLPGTIVLPAAGTAPGDGTAVLSVTVLRLDAEAAGRVVLEAQWSLSAGGAVAGGAVRHRETLEVPAASGEPVALVAAMSRAVALFADRVAAAVRR